MIFFEYFMKRKTCIILCVPIRREHICDMVTDGNVLASGAKPPASVKKKFQSSLLQQFIVTRNRRWTESIMDNVSMHDEDPKIELY